MFWRLTGLASVILTLVMAVSFTVHSESWTHPDELTVTSSLAGKGRVLIASEGASKPSVELKWAKPRLLPLVSFRALTSLPPPTRLVYQRMPFPVFGPLVPRLIGMVELRL